MIALLLSYFTTIAAAWTSGRVLVKPGKKLIETSTTSTHTSQTLIDPYSISHVLHGIIFYYVFRFLPIDQNLTTSFALECLWEIVENSPIIIDRYRKNTISLNYTGDSILNITGDLLSMLFGWIVAFMFPWYVSLIVAVTAELLMLYRWRDNLFLNVLMIIYPMERVRSWQLKDVSIDDE